MGDGLTLEKLKIAEGLATNTEAIKNMGETLVKLEAKVTIQNGKVNKLENIYSYAMGIIGTIGFIFGLIVVVLNWIKH